MRRFSMTLKLTLRRKLIAGVLTSTLLLTGCAQHNSHTTLYERMGGQPTIDAVVDNLLYRIADDDEVVVYFANSNIDLFAASLATQLCEISDGPCTYDGPPMDRAHQTMGITDAHFNRVVEYLDAAMQEEGVTLAARNDMLGRLAPLYKEVMRLR